MDEGNTELEVIPEDISDHEPFQHQIFYNVEVETDDNYITLNDVSNSESDTDSDNSIVETEKWEENKTIEKIFRKFDPNSKHPDYYLTLSKLNEKQQRYCCLTCGSQYLRLKHLFKHKKTHRPPNVDPLNLPDLELISGKVCYLCSKTFRNEDLLLEHIKDVHFDVKELQCNICNKMFSRSCQLRNHLIMHTGVRKFTCNICEKKFKQSGHLLNHKRIHSDERKFICSFCSKSFKQNIHLKSHLKTHTGEKDHLCIICKKQFKQSGHLQMHMRIHTGERKYSCTFCKSKFKQSGHLSSHMKVHDRLNRNHFKLPPNKRYYRGMSGNDISQSDRLLLENDLKQEEDEKHDEESYANRLERNRRLIEEWRQSEAEKEEPADNQQTLVKDEEIDIPNNYINEECGESSKDNKDAVQKEDNFGHIIILNSQGLEMKRTAKKKKLM